MDCMRINCAHDNAAAWLRIIEHLRRAERSLERPCRGRNRFGRPDAQGRWSPTRRLFEIPTAMSITASAPPAWLWLTRETSKVTPDKGATLILPIF
jgi:pyruvate kinase